MQRESDDLRKWFDHAKEGHIAPAGKTPTVKFIIERGLLYHVFQTELARETKQLAVPVSLRNGVLRLAHNSIMSGHLGNKKTLDRVLSQFAWPGIAGDVTCYCRSCDACQRTVHKGRVTKAPLQKMPVVSVPFQRVGIDLLGPVSSVSSSGCRFILTVVDYATRYPEAVALEGITTQEVAEALCKEDQREELLKLLDEFSDIFTDLPGKTSVAEHRIQLTDDRPIRCKPYPLPHTLRDDVKSEVEEMCRLGVIERSNSPYSSPLLLVKKKDGTNRPVVDFRQVNKVTLFDAEPLPSG